MHAKINFIEEASDKIFISEKTILLARIIDMSNNT